MERQQERLRKQLVAALTAHQRSGRPPVVPEAGRLVFGWFCELSAARSYGAAGPNPISHDEIDAWARLGRWPIQPRHVAAIRALDRAWIDHARQPHEGPISEPKLERRLPPQAVNPSAFDAVFG